MKNVLFICTGNTCRSPMAEAIFNDMCQKNGLPHHARSAGVATVDGLPAAKNAIETMAQLGIDLTNHKARFLPNVRLSDYDLFVTMNYDQATLVESLGVPREYIKVLEKSPADKYDIEIGIADPFGGDMLAYRKCAEDLKTTITQLIDTL